MKVTHGATCCLAIFAIMCANILCCAACEVLSGGSLEISSTSISVGEDRVLLSATVCNSTSVPIFIGERSLLRFTLSSSKNPGHVLMQSKAVHLVEDPNSTKYHWEPDFHRTFRVEYNFSQGELSELSLAYWVCAELEIYDDNDSKKRVVVESDYFEVNE